MDWGGGRKREESESWLILSELEASAPSQNIGGLSLLVPESAVKCPVEETHGQQPKEKSV